jgi:NADH-quinone oxidoreductase subunit L
MYVYRPGLTLELRDRYARLHDFLVHKWYFDELYDVLFVRPAAAFGRFGQTVVESAFVQGVVIGGATSVVRASTGLARGIQTGYLRAYALVLVMGLSGLGLYFLLQAS